MVPGPRTRYVTAFVLAVAGGLAASITAAALEVDGLAEYGILITCGAIFVLPATALTANIGPGGLRKAGTRSADKR